MILKIYRITFLLFLTVMALVAGGALYQTISIVPFWQKDISMFKNYGHWGINYFPVLSPLMTVLWLVLVVTGIKIKFPNKGILYFAHLVFLLVMGSTFFYFAPFLLTHMGQPKNNIPDAELLSLLNNWAKWDLIRQLIGLLMLPMYIYAYSNIRYVTISNPDRPR